MAAYAARRSTGPVIRSISPSSRFGRRYSTQSSPVVSHFAARVETHAAAPVKRTCLCSPTNHPGSFRCSLHKGGSLGGFPNSTQTASYGRSGGSNMRRSAVKNSLVRMGTVEGDLVKRALAALIRPSSHQQRRRGDFNCRPSRLSVMSNA